MKICGFQIRAYLTQRKRNREDLGHDENYCSPESLGYFFEDMPFQNLIQEEKKKVFDQIKCLLTKREKDIIELSLRGLSVKEIMESLDISRNSYGSYKSRAVKKAKAFFANKSIQDYKA